MANRMYAYVLCFQNYSVLIYNPENIKGYYSYEQKLFGCFKKIFKSVKVS